MVYKDREQIGVDGVLAGRLVRRGGDNGRRGGSAIQLLRQSRHLQARLFVRRSADGIGWLRAELREIRSALMGERTAQFRGVFVRPHRRWPR